MIEPDCHGTPTLILADPNDGPDNHLECKQVGGFGEPMLALFVRQDGDRCGINLTVATARELRDFLDAFTREAAGDA